MNELVPIRPILARRIPSCRPTLGDDLYDSFQSGVRDLFQRRAPRECHGQIKFRQNILDHLANSVFPGNGQTVDVGTPETDR
jgi:hypothetical protein